jgi:hypothetical protein
MLAAIARVAVEPACFGFGRGAIRARAAGEARARTALRACLTGVAAGCPSFGRSVACTEAPRWKIPDPAPTERMGASVEAESFAGEEPALRREENRAPTQGMAVPRHRTRRGRSRTSFRSHRLLAAIEPGGVSNDGSTGAIRRAPRKERRSTRFGRRKAGSKRRSYGSERRDRGSYASYRLFERRRSRFLPTLSPFRSKRTRPRSSRTSFRSHWTSFRSHRTRFRTTNRRERSTVGALHSKKSRWQASLRAFRADRSGVRCEVSAFRAERSPFRAGKWRFRAQRSPFRAKRSSFPCKLGPGQDIAYSLLRVQDRSRSRRTRTPRACWSRGT